ncbi:MAG: helix-turn-helix transcriptional regulator [Sulfurospirillaceae bacterium]|nr:helix-turn-helix transcriptional regulator [Sulfurospirillaceae bacterium]
MNLTNREKQVLRLAAQGNSDKQIGNILKISSRTVQTHLGKIYAKLGVNNRITAVALYIKECKVYSA